MKRIIFSILLIGLVLLLASSVAGCARNPLYVYRNGNIIESGGDGKPIELINNPDATNPTYAELVAFIKADATDTKSYVERGLEGAYVCSDFVEDVHNNAEAAGIRAAFVGMNVEEEDGGHALNAFETTDRGLVYIDCTGGKPSAKSKLWDTVAYIEIGQEYGRIEIDKAKSLSYSFYEEYKQKWQENEKLKSDFNEEVARYNQETRGKVYSKGSPERARIEAWKAELEEKKQAIAELSKELSRFWLEAPGGAIVVKDTYMRW